MKSRSVGLGRAKVAAPVQFLYHCHCSEAAQQQHLQLSSIKLQVADGVAYAQTC